MVAATEKLTDDDNPSAPVVHPQREAWVSLIAGYCLGLGAVEVAWQIGLLCFSRFNALSEIRYYLNQGSLRFDWSQKWAFALPLCEIWNHYVVIVVHFFVGIRLWITRENAKRSAAMAIVASLLGAVFGALLQVAQYIQGRGPLRVPQVTASIACALLAQIVLFCVLLWSIFRDRPDRDRWRAVLASWLILNGVCTSCYVFYEFWGLGTFGIPIGHPGWRTISWDTLWPITSVLRAVAGISGIACGLFILRATTKLTFVAWIIAITMLLSDVASRFLIFVISNNSMWPGKAGTVPVEFKGFRAVGWDAWAEVLHSLLKSIAVGVPLIIFAYHQARRLEAESVSCRHCGYNLTGNTSGRCPECGNPTGAN